MFAEETKEIVFSRLRLAQQLLEESDRLPGLDGHDFKDKKWWLHPRHEREALVVYLLLTCFDKLGQKRNFTTFSDWLKSKKVEHTTEKEKIVASISESIDVVESSLRLFEGYQAIFGVRNSFYEGVTALPDDLRNRLLGSITLSFNPEYGTRGPNVSTPSKSFTDKELELKLRLKFLYGKRNGFTHRLDQYHRSSVPMMSEHGFKNGSSWAAMIDNKRISYMTSHQDIEKLASGGANVYTINNWPFVLFEVLYAAIGMAFNRTSINLKFRVMDYSDDKSTVAMYNDVEHKHLQDYDTFLRMAEKLKMKL